MDWLSDIAAVTDVSNFLETNLDYDPETRLYPFNSMYNL